MITPVIAYLLLFNKINQLKTILQTNANANVLFCYLMLMSLHYIYKQANANAISNV